MFLNFSVPLIWNNKDGIVPFEYVAIFQLDQKTEKGNLKMQIRVA